MAILPVKANKLLRLPTSYHRFALDNIFDVNYDVSTSIKSVIEEINYDPTHCLKYF